MTEPNPSAHHDDRADQLDGITGYVNFRDLGGQPTPRGVMRDGRVFRSDSLAHCTPAEVAALVGEFGVRTVLDLRHGSEIARFPLTALADAGITVEHVSLLNPASPTVLPTEPRMLTLANLYRGILESSPDRLFDALRIVATVQHHPVVFMCSAGKDRTGLLAALLLGLLGADDDVIVAEYALTAHHVDAIVARASARGSEVAVPGLEHLMRADAETMVETLEWFHGEFGSFEAYADANGFGADDVATLRAQLLTPA